MLKLVIIDDEPMIIESLRAYFEKEGFVVYSAFNGAEGLHLIQTVHPDLIILDLMLPDVLGEEICREIRKNSNVPIMMLTAKAAEDDRINGIEIGADDYLLKPFSPREVVVRAKGILRRAGINTTGELSFNNKFLVINLIQKKVTIGQAEVQLTPIEFKILAEMAKYPDRAFNRVHLLEMIQDDNYYEGYERIIDVHIKNLRKKIEKNTKEPEFIITVFGTGYKFGGQIDAKNTPF